MANFFHDFIDLVEAIPAGPLSYQVLVERVRPPVLAVDFGGSSRVTSPHFPLTVRLDAIAWGVSSGEPNQPPIYLLLASLDC